MATPHTHFLSCDWGTTSFRLQLCSLVEHRVVGSIKSDDGAKSIGMRGGDAKERATAFEQHLRGAALQLLTDAGLTENPIPVVVSGMASSSIGWKELPYAKTPFPVDGSGAVVERMSLELSSSWELPVFLVSGLATSKEMMRGEETQLIGLLGLPHFKKFVGDSVVVLPGTHSKHIRVKDGQVVDLQTFMTGELYQVLTQHSVLRFTTLGDSAADVGGTAFEEGVREVLEHGLSQTLFQVRTRGVLGGKNNDQNRAYLCGVLIGDEVSALTRTADRPPILFAMSGEMSELYMPAARLVGVGDRAEAVNHELLDQLVVEGQAQTLARIGSVSAQG